MNILIIGGVAAGTKTAAKCKRQMPGADVTLLTRDQGISYALCALPYYVGGLVEDKQALSVTSPASFQQLTGVNVHTSIEVVSLDADKKRVIGQNVQTQEKHEFVYDKLVLCTGASAVVPPIEGVHRKGVFTLRTPQDAESLRAYIEDTDAKRAVIVGGGFIGLEMAENLQHRGMAVHVVESASQILPGALDEEMALYLKKHLLRQSIAVTTGTKIQAIQGQETVNAVKTDAGVFAADVVVLATGVQPNTQFLQGSGITLERGLILVDEQMRTNLPDVFAAGDCALVKNRLTGKRQWSAMGSSANCEGRLLGQVLVGEERSFGGVLGTAVLRLPRLNCARTGLSEKQAVQEGYDVITTLAVTDDKASAYPDASFFITKLIAQRQSGKLLGMQVFGPGAVDKMCDIAVLALSMGAVLSDFDDLDFAYAPPFSSAIHPFVQAVHILENKKEGLLESMTPLEYLKGKAQGYRVIDAGSKPSIAGATFVDLATFDGEIPGVSKDEKLLLVCNRGRRAYLLQTRLRHNGYTHTRVLEGATFVNDVRAKTSGFAVPAGEIARVKGLGFLQDKTSVDKFNARVITRNGKITARESAAIAEAAQLYGSGEIAMTSRLTVEIQGVPFANIEPLRAYLGQFGLETGGTGSKVRPVVSCKGTTCQYGLIDTFALSEQIHERFYLGYREVKLPHKFKIAVGGCPNNCVKPDLNDLGIVGQRVPRVNLETCRSCKVCQIENACPIHVAKLHEGKLIIDESACNHCGRCVGKCPFGALTEELGGYRVFIGGRWGKKVAQGKPLEPIFTSQEEVLSIVEKAILLFREQGVSSERFADTIARLGFENVQSQLLSDDLLLRKEENLREEKHSKGGATC